MKLNSAYIPSRVNQSHGRRLSALPASTVKTAVPTLSFRNLQQGSTLVEMVVTVGLLVSVMLPLVGMLSMGMDTSLKAGINTVGSRITSQLMGEVQQAKWEELDRWNDRTFYFDDQGLVIRDAGQEGMAAFTAQVKVSNEGVTLTTQSSQKNEWQRKVTTVVSPANGKRGEQLLNDALTALAEGKPMPASVRVGHSLVTKTSKDT